MRKKWLIIAAAVLLLGLSLAPLFPDPYHEKSEGVSFWEWLYKELIELVYGEHVP